MYHRYFVIKDGPAIDAAQQAVKDRKEAIAQAVILRDELGASDVVGLRGRVLGFLFNEEPDLSIWRQVDNHYRPKKNCNAGKAIAEKINALPMVADPCDAALEALKLPTGPAIFSDTNNSCYSAGAIYFHVSNTVLVTLPWLDKDPIELDAYQKEREEKTRFSCELDYLLTEFHPSMVEIKAWEFEKFKHDLSEAAEKQIKEGTPS